MRVEPPFRRPVGFKLHRCIALALGFILALIGLSGSLSVYRSALDLWLNPRLSVIAPPSAKALSLDLVLQAVRAEHPQRRGSWTLELPSSQDGTLTAWYEHPQETQGRFYAPLMVSVNPYTAEVLASRFWGETAATRLLDLHTHLALGRFGWNCVGLMGTALILLLISGLWLWWPGTAALGRAFAVRSDAGAGKLASDLHRLLGLAAALPLLALGFTGFNLSFPGLPQSLLGASDMGHDDAGPAIRSTAVPNDRAVGPEEATLLARGPFSHAEVRRVTTPEGPTGAYRVSLRQPWEVSHRHPYTTVWVDQYSGQIREVRNPAHFGAGESALTWLWPLHTGEAFGPSYKLLWFIAGLTPALLFMAGLFGWLVRRRLLRDVPVDFAPLKEDFRHLAGVARRIPKQGLRAADWALSQALLAAKTLHRKYAQTARNGGSRFK